MRNQETRETAKWNTEWCGKGRVGETDRNSVGLGGGSGQWPRKEREEAQGFPSPQAWCVAGTYQWALALSCGLSWSWEDRQDLSANSRTDADSV